MKEKKKAPKKKAPAPIDNKTPQQKALEALYSPAGVQGGQALIDTYLQPGFLGKVSTTSPEQQDYLNRLKGGLEGYTSQEYQAQREQMQKGIDSAQKTAQDQLARSQARGKVYGAAAGAQQQNLIRGGEDRKADLEQQLMVQNINERQNRLNQYGQAQSAYDQAMLEREKINLGNQAAETSARVNAITGAGASALNDAQVRAAQQINREGIRAVNPSRGSSRRRRR